MPTLTATVGSASANSFVTLTEAATYFDERPDSECWLEYSAVERERALIYAGKQLNAMDWLGNRVNGTQSMAWPRYEVWKPDGFTEYLSTEIPQAVKDAQCEIAYQVIRATALTSSASSGAVRSFTQGDVSITYDTSKAGSSSVITTTENLTVTLLYGLLSSGTRLMRA